MDGLDLTQRHVAPCGAMWRHVAHTDAAEETPEPRGEGERRGVISQQFQGSQVGFSEGPIWTDDTDVRGPGRRPIHAPRAMVMSCG